MTVIAIGLDVVDVRRIEGLLTRHGARLLDRIALPDEAGVAQGRRFAERVAGMFAAKEAVLKALGTGWAEGLAPRQVEVRREASGQPRIVLHGAARERAASLGAHRVHISITHERSWAAAVALLESAA